MSQNKIITTEIFQQKQICILNWNTDPLMTSKVEGNLKITSSNQLLSEQLCPNHVSV